MKDSWLVSNSKWNPPQRLLTRLDSKWKTRSFSWGERRARTFVSLQKWALRNTSRTAAEGEKKKALAAARCTACLCAAGKAQIFKPTAYNIATGCTLEDLLLPAQDTGVRIITVPRHQRKHIAAWPVLACNEEIVLLKVWILQEGTKIWLN